MFKKSLLLEKKQKERVFEELFQNSFPGFDLFLLLVLSTIIVTFGLLINSVAIIVGGMLIAPILWPTLSLAMGIEVNDTKLMKSSTKVILKAVGLIVLISAFISLIYLDRELNPEITSRANYFLTYFFVALFSGIGASYAFSRPRLSSVLPGIAISVALIPPLCVMGIAVSFFDWGLLVKAMGVFFLNILGIIFGALMVFSILDFDEIKKEIKKKVQETEKKIEKEKTKKEARKDIQEIEKTLKEVSELLDEKKKNV